MPAAHSLVTAGRNIILVAQKLHVQPECPSHREELVSTAQQILLDTTKVRLMAELAGQSSLLGGLDGVCHSHSGHPPKREACPSFCQDHKHRVHYQFHKCEVWKLP